MRLGFVFSLEGNVYETCAPLLRLMAFHDLRLFDWPRSLFIACGHFVYPGLFLGPSRAAISNIVRVEGKVFCNCPGSRLSQPTGARAQPESLASHCGANNY